MYNWEYAVNINCVLFLHKEEILSDKRLVSAMEYWQHFKQCEQVFSMILDNNLRATNIFR